MSNDNSYDEALLRQILNGKRDHEDVQEALHQVIPDLDKLDWESRNQLISDTRRKLIKEDKQPLKLVD